VTATVGTPREARRSFLGPVRRRRRPASAPPVKSPRSCASCTGWGRSRWRRPWSGRERPSSPRRRPRAANPSPVAAGYARIWFGADSLPKDSMRLLPPDLLRW